MRNGILLLLLLGCIGISPLFAEVEYSIVQVTYLPPIYYVGDSVEVRIRIVTLDGVRPLEPTEFPQTSWVSIREVRVIPISDEYDIRITFASFQPGLRTLPPISFGSVVIDSVRIDTKSILTNDSVDFVDVYGPLILPGSRIMLVLSVGALLLVPIITIVTIALLRKLAGKIRLFRKRKRPFRQLAKDLDELQSKLPTEPDRGFYILLSDKFRRYLSTKMNPDYASFTTAELQVALIEDYPEISELGKMAELLPVFDAIKFGSQHSSFARRTEDLSLVKETARLVEEYFARIQKTRLIEEGNHVDT